MNPFQHSAVAATIYEVLDDANLRADQDELGTLACRLAEVLAKTHKVELGKPPDDIADYLDDPHGATGFYQAFAKSLEKAVARANKKRSRRSHQRHP